MPIQPGQYGPGVSSTVPLAPSRQNPQPLQEYLRGGGDQPGPQLFTPDVGEAGPPPPEDKTGTAALTQTSTTTAAGTKTARGAATVTQPTGATGTGVRTIGGAATIVQPSAATAIGVKGGRGTATVAHPSTAIGSAAKTAAGAASIETSSDAVGDGTAWQPAPGGSGIGFIVQPSAVSASGIRSEEPPVTPGGGGGGGGSVQWPSWAPPQSWVRSGRGRITATHVTSAAGVGFLTAAGAADELHLDATGRAGGTAGRLGVADTVSGHRIGAHGAGVVTEFEEEELMLIGAL